MKYKDILNHLYDYNQIGLETTFGYRTVNDFCPRTIFVPTFGKSIGADSYNARLAIAVHDARKIFGDIPTILQREVYDEYKQRYADPCTAVCKPLLKDTIIGTDIKTRDALIESLAYTPNENRQHILYIAHPAHMFRVIEMGNKLGLQGMPFLPETFYNHNDGQKFCNNAHTFAIREFMVRVHHKLIGWI